MWKWLVLIFALSGCTIDVCPSCDANIAVKACFQVQLGDASFVTCPTAGAPADAMTDAADAGD